MPAPLVAYWHEQPGSRWTTATGGAGLSNVGLLATVWGEVTDVQSDMYDSLYFKLNDGSDTEVKAIDLLFDGMLLTPPPAVDE